MGEGPPQWLKWGPWMPGWYWWAATSNWFNTFGTNWSANCEPGVVTQAQGLSSPMLLVFEGSKIQTSCQIYKQTNKQNVPKFRYPVVSHLQTSNWKSSVLTCNFTIPSTSERDTEHLMWTWFDKYWRHVQLYKTVERVSVLQKHILRYVLSLIRSSHYLVRWKEQTRFGLK